MCISLQEITTYYSFISLFFLPVNNDAVIGASYNPEVTVFVFIPKIT